MIIVDRRLAQRERDGKPIRVGMVGAGFMGRGIALQIFSSTPGMRLVAIANRHLEAARRAYTEAGASQVTAVDSLAHIADVIGRGGFAITEDPYLVTGADGIDAIIEVTGTVEYAAGVVLDAIAHGKHVVMMNAELDGTVGPVLKTYADRAGVVLTNADGDQPGVLMNLHRFVTGIGAKPVLCGNIKGLHDPYRNPTTQEGFARMWKQQPHLVTSFADGSKISFEQAIVANATGMRVAKRGMYGPTVPTGAHVQDSMTLFPLAELSAGPGVVDYVVGAVPSPGVFVIGRHDNPTQQDYLNLFKLGPGPFYCFYTPYHLCHFEVPSTVARAVLFGDPAIAPIDGILVDVVATAKIDLTKGQVLDGIGYYMTYGQCENAEIALAERLLPMGLAEGCRLRRDVRKDEVLTRDDVDLPNDRLSDRLRAEQDALALSTTSERQ